MMKKFRFYKDTENNKWFIDLSDYSGDKKDLEIVNETGKLLEIYSKGRSEVTLKLYLSEYPGSGKLTRIERKGSGFEYLFTKPEIQDFKIWFGNVIKFIYGSYPKFIFIKET